MARMKYIRPVDDAAAIETGFPEYRAQLLSHLESGLFIASTIGEKGCGPGLHYHHSDQIYYLVHGSMNVRLGHHVHSVVTGSLVFIPAGLAHCNWNSGLGAETHLEMIIPAPSPLKQKIAYMVDSPEDVPEEYKTNRKGYIRHVDPSRLKQPLPGFWTAALADPSCGSLHTVINYSEVAVGSGGPKTHIHEFDQYYFVLDGELTIEVALQKYTVGPNTLVILPAGVPHRQYNAGSTTEKHLAILAPAPEEGLAWDAGVSFAATGEAHSGNLNEVGGELNAQI